MNKKTGSISQIVEVTHEALLDYWAQLKEWLNEDRDDLRLQKRLESAAEYWKKQQKPSGLLWSSPVLDLVRSLYRNKKDDFSALQEEFYLASQRAVKLKRSINILVVCFIITVIGATFYSVKKQESIAKANEKKAEAQVLVANYNLARAYEETAAIAIREGETNVKNYQKAWLYTLEALNQDIPAGKSLPKSLKKLEKHFVHFALGSACISQDKRCRAFVSAGMNVRAWESDLFNTYLKSGKESPEFKAVYKCSFDLLPFRMEGISLTADKTPGDLPFWYNEYPQGCSIPTTD